MTFTPLELLIARLLAELEATPPAARAAVVQRYETEHPTDQSTIRQIAALQVGIASRKTPATTPEPQLPRNSIFGPYKIIDFIKRGGMGEVYVAWHIYLHRHVALKVIRNDLDAPMARARFDCERQVLARLHQTNIVPIFDAGEVDGVQYCAMHYVLGVTLHSVVTTLLQQETSAPARRQTPPLQKVVETLMQTPTPAATLVAKGAAPVSDQKLSLSPRYFNSVAATMLQVADAVHYGHNQQVIHRDIKPSNLMISSQGLAWVIDYGLASDATRRDSIATFPTDGGNGCVAEGKLTAGPLGTPQYMAPERFAGHTDVRGDIWGIGVVFYELLTLRAAIAADDWTAAREQVTKGEIRPLRKLVRNVPRDLAAICNKAMTRDPASRYPSAEAFAQDIRCWQTWYPTSVRPGWWTLRPLRLWSWRNRATAAVLLAGLLLLAGTAVRAYEQKEQQRKELLLQKRDMALLQSQKRVAEPRLGWSREVFQMVREANDIRPDPALKDQGALTLGGMDASIRQLEFPIGASSVAWNPNGPGLILGGATFLTSEGWQSSPARLWDGAAASEFLPTTIAGGGPVAYRADGTPIHVVLPTGDRWSLLVCDVRKPQPLAEIPLPLPGTYAPMAELSADGSLLAASVGNADGQPSRTLVWKLLPKPEVVYDWPVSSSAFAFSPDRKYLACGSADGTVSVRSLADGEPVRTFREKNASVTSLAFGRNYRAGPGRPEKPATSLGDWLLAVGGKTGYLAVWQLAPEVRLNGYAGSQHDVHGVTFGADGTTLLAVGRNEPRIWDVATGRQLLALTNDLAGQPRNTMTAAAFSPNGKRVAITSLHKFGNQGGIDLYALEYERGVREFRGLESEVTNFALSAQGHYVAALSMSWQVGIWNATSGELLHVFDAPPGLWADNAALAFSRDETELVFASGTRVTKWTIANGQTKTTWTLPTLGLCDCVAELPSGNWLLFRNESARTPWGRASSGWSPVTRELKPDGTFAESYRLAGFEKGASYARMSPDASRLLVELSGTGELKYRLVDAVTGRDLVIPNLPPTTTRSGSIRMDSTGQFLNYHDWVRPGIPERCTFFELPSGTMRPCTVVNNDRCDPTGRLYTQSDIEARGLGVHRVQSGELIIRFDAGRNVLNNYRILFSPDSRHVLWGRADGTVCLADLDRCIDALAVFRQK